MTSFVRRQGRTEVIESDICIIGSGITAALVAEKLAEEREARIVVVEAGDDTVPLAERAAHRARFVAYGENPWGRDHIDGMTADGIQSRSMLVGGLAMHWGGVTPRFSPEDFRVQSLYGAVARTNTPPGPPCSSAATATSDGSASRANRDRRSSTHARIRSRCRHSR